MRGGSPGIKSLPLRRSKCLPRARGFTQKMLDFFVEPGVSSPCAGVHLRTVRDILPIVCVFPVRGGSPRMKEAPDGRLPCLPRARGFTSARREPLVWSAVSSPCAGVHRSVGLAGRMIKGVFPVRGGSPAVPVSAMIARMCLPRARGFTPCAGVHRNRAVLVSSPCAGVHRCGNAGAHC